MGGVIPAANGFFGTVDEPTLFLAGEGGGPEQVNIQPYTGPAASEGLMYASGAAQPASRSRDFLNESFRTAIGNTPWARTGQPTPVGVSAPGTSPWLQQMAAALAALGSGIAPELFLNEAAAATPMGISAAPTRRTR